MFSLRIGTVAWIVVIKAPFPNNADICKLVRRIPGTCHYLIFFAFCGPVLSKQPMKIIYAFALKVTFKLAITLQAYAPAMTLPNF